MSDLLALLQANLQQVLASPRALMAYCPVPLIREQSRCSFSRIESAVAVHLNGWQLVLYVVTK